MKRRILIALAILSFAAAEAYDITSVCPYDGDEAYFSGTKITASGTQCNYRHTHYDQDSHRNVNHSFWVPCGD